MASEITMLSKFNECLNATYITVDNEADYAFLVEDDTLKLYFEPSDGKTDWRNNFDFPAKPYRDMKNLWYCHRGFLKVWKSIEPYIESNILDLNIRKIEIVGYSHGAAVAALCYEYVKFNRPDIEVSGIGFGAPRVLWGIPSKSVLERFAGFIVVRNGNDLITHLPPALFGFRHIGKVVKIGKSIGFITDHYPDSYKKGLINHGF